MEMKRCKGSGRLEKLGKLSTGGLRVFGAFEGSSPQPMRVFALSSTYLSADG